MQSPDHRRMATALVITLVLLAIGAAAARSLVGSDTPPAEGAGSPQDGTPASTPEPADDGPAQTEEPADQTTPRSTHFIITLENGTAGASVPTEMPIRLRQLNPVTGTLDDQEAVVRDGQIALENVTLAPDEVLLATVTYQGIDFLLLLEFRDITGTRTEDTITIFETTRDPAVFHLNSVQHIADAASAEGVAEIITIFNMRNESDRVYVGTEGDDVVMQVTLPPGAIEARLLHDDTRGLEIDLSQTPAVLSDSRPLFPGESRQVLVNLFLTYTGRLRVTHELAYAADEVIVYVREPRKLIFRGRDFNPTGVVNIQGWGVYLSHTSEDVPAGEEILFTLRDGPQTP